MSSHSGWVVIGFTDERTPSGNLHFGIVHELYARDEEQRARARAQELANALDFAYVLNGEQFRREPPETA